MRIELPFNYINLLAFSTLLKFENKRYINIETLKEYHKVLLEEVLKDYYNKTTEYYQEIDLWNGEIEFTINEYDNIENFIDKYENFFYQEGDTIYLRNEIQYQELVDEHTSLLESEYISNRFESNSLNQRLLNALGIKNIKNAIEKYIRLEKELEKYYYELNYNNTSKENTEKIKKLLFMRALFLMNIGQNEFDKIDAFRLISTTIIEDKYEYEIPPIDIELWENSKYSKNDGLGDIDDRIFDLYQYAIFGNTSMSYRKVENIITNLCFFEELDTNKLEIDIMQNEDWFENNIDYNELFFDDEQSERSYYLYNSEEEDLAFYLNYINKINEYMNMYGEHPELIKTKNRLLYSLDTHKLCLYQEDRLQEQIEKAKEYKPEEEDFEFIEDEVRFMAEEVFLVGTNQYTLKKLLFISTYYDLTKDKTIVKIINKHKNNENYNLYSQIIFGFPKGYSRKKKK